MKNRLQALAIAVLLLVVPILALGPRVTAQQANQTLSCGTNSVPIPGPRIPVSGFANQGDKLKIVEVSVPSNLQGKNVSASAEVTNALSVRSGSDINIVSSGTNLALLDVESTPNKVTTASGQLTLGATVDVVLTFGVGGVFSGGGILTIKVDCPSDSQSLVCGVNNVQIPQTVVRGAAGDTSKLTELTVPASLQGKSVTASAQAVNNTSVHPGTSLIISSNSTSFSLNDIEGSANKVTNGSGQLTLGSTVEVTVKLGSDGVFSGGGNLTITIDCPEGGRGSGTPQVTATPTIVNAGGDGVSELKSAAVLGLSGSLIALGLGIRRLAKHLL